MRIYNDGDEKRGGFRFLNDVICIDFVAENQPIEQYLNEIVSYVNENSLKKIFIYSHYKEAIDIPFLNDCQQVEELQISALCKDLESVYKLHLSKLSLQIQDYPVSFEKLSRDLVDLDLYNIKIRKVNYCLNPGILTCKQLRYLSVSYVNNEDLELIVQMPWIEELGLAYFNAKSLKIPYFGNMRKLTSLFFQKMPEKILKIVKELPQLKSLACAQIPFSTLSRMENLRNLQKLQINYCTKLTDISALRECLNLKILEFTACKQIKDFTPLSQLNNLERLQLFNCGEISSLKFIESMENLKSLVFMSTNILDGDLSPCMRLEYAGTNDKRHYNIKAKDLPHNCDNQIPITS